MEQLPNDDFQTWDLLIMSHGFDQLLSPYLKHKFSRMEPIGEMVIIVLSFAFNHSVHWSVKPGMVKASLFVDTSNRYVEGPDSLIDSYLLLFCGTWHHIL